MNLFFIQTIRLYAKRHNALSIHFFGSPNRGYFMPQFLLSGLLVLLSVFLSSSLLAAPTKVLNDSIMLFSGESKVLQAADVSRLSVGNSDIISSTLLKNGEIVLIAEKAGETNMQFWFSDGHRETVSVRVVESNGLSRESRQVKQLLKNIPGVDVSTVDQRIVVDGNIEARDLERINKLKETYPQMLILAREITDYEQKMIYFDIQVVEVNRDTTEEYGINWSKSFNGPTYAYQNTWKGNAFENQLYESTSAVEMALGRVLTDESLPIADQKTLIDKATGEFYGFGIGSKLLSVINLSV